MKAKLILRQTVIYDEQSSASIVVWAVPVPVPPSTPGIKYRLAYVVDGVRVIGFDNERGKGDHVHRHGAEMPYVYVSVERLLEDFFHEIEKDRS